jgi:transcriptional regulator with GAF, ATPase, and Fis domain
MTQSPVRLIGRSEFHHRALAELTCAAQTDVEILLLGPTGVGKEVYARWTHEHSPRAERKFVPVNCGALPASLFENELFGHVGGAFTGAQAASDGVVAEADGGTLFLDEIDALDTACQVKLLRFLQEREYRRLGESRMRRSNVRIVTASNADLAQLVRESRFREDLLFRIHVFPVRIPPLRERADDIRPLIEEYVERCAGNFRLPPIRLTDEAMCSLETYSWPGNVRELENCIRYLTSLGLKRPVKACDLKLFDNVNPGRAPAPAPSDAAAAWGEQSLREAKRTLVSTFERNFVIAALRKSRGNIAHAARSSGKTRRAFFELLRKYNVSASDYR